MDDRQSDTLSDSAIDREIEAMLALEPSPAFLARVRTTIADASAVSRFPRLLPAAGGLAIAMALVIVVSFLISRDETPHQADAVVPTPSVAARSSNRPVPPPMPLMATCIPTHWQASRLRRKLSC